VSTKGRASLKLIFDSDPYRAWAKLPANAKEVAKIDKAYAGAPHTQPSSKYAKGLVGLCEENPPSGTPIPPTPPGTAVAAVWKLDAAFSNGGLSNFNGAPRDRALATGWKAVYVQLLNIAPDQISANLAEMVRTPWNPWTKIGWGTYGQNTDPEQDGRDAAALCKAHPQLAGWKANGEAWAEQQYQWKTGAFLKGWVDGGAPVPLGWSVLSSDTANFAREFDYATALSVAGADIDLQVYGATAPTYTVGAGLGMLAQVKPTPVPVQRTTMTFDVTDTGLGPFPDYRTWSGPRRLWNVGNATVATFDALIRT